MARPFSSLRSAVVMVASQNEFLSEEGVFWGEIREVAESVGLLANLVSIRQAALEAGVPVFYAPRRMFAEDELDGWRHPTPAQIAASRVNGQGEWGCDWPTGLAPQTGDVVASAHWLHSAFANTDLDFLLKQHAVQRLIVVGPGANTGVEATARAGVELGYHVMLVRDATAAASEAAMAAAHAINGPAYAHAIVTTAEVVAALKE
jgi:nicotinamidase-related amidase